MKRYRCWKCHARVYENEVLWADHPFALEAGEKITGCPKCREPNTLYLACDEPGCWDEASCGTPTPNGYRQTCGDHRPQ